MNVAIETAVRLACIQFEPLIGEVAANLAAMERLIRKAQAEGARIVVLPELSDTGYVFESSAELARLGSAIPSGSSTQQLCRLAAELSIYIVVGLAELDGDTAYNAAVLVGPRGYIGKYRKLHLWNREKLFFREGNLGLPVFATEVGNIGLAICYDGWFPETFRQLTLKGADLICVPTNWVPMAGHDQHPEAMATILHKAAAHSNAVYIACADRVGTERGQPFIGQSVVVGPDGWPLAGPAGRQGEEILVADIAIRELKRRRTLNEFNDVLGDRREDIYGGISQVESRRS